MRRLLRLCLSFSLVSACCVLFSLGVNAAAEIPEGAITDEAQLFAALPGNSITTIDTYNSWYDLPLVPKEERFKDHTYYYLNQQVFAPRYTNGAVIRDYVDLFSLSTTGYTSYEYNEYRDVNQGQYYKKVIDRISFNKPFYIGGEKYFFGADTNKTIIMQKTDIAKGENVFLRNNLGFMLEPGIEYELGLSLQKMVPSSAWLASWDTSVNVKSTVVDNKHHTITFVFTVPEKVMLYRTYVGMTYADGGFLELNGAYIYPHDDTADKINANNDKIHQETMDKIDEVTDFNEQSQSDLSNDVSSTTQSVDEKLGILNFSTQVLENVVGLFSDPPGEPVLTFPAFSMTVDGEKHHIWESVQVDLSVLLKDFSVLVTPVRFALVLLVYLALVNYLGSVLEKILNR